MRCLLLIAIFTILCTPPAGAMVRVQQPSGSELVSTGFFGGIKKGDTLVLNLTLNANARYFRVSPTFTIVWRGERIPLDRLPLDTPVKVTTEKGAVVRVELLRGDQ